MERFEDNIIDCDCYLSPLVPCEIKIKDILTEKLEMNEKYIRVILWLLYDKKTELRYGI